MKYLNGPLFYNLVNELTAAMWYLFLVDGDVLHDVRTDGGVVVVGDVQIQIVGPVNHVLVFARELELVRPRRLIVQRLTRVQHQIAL